MSADDRNALARQFEQDLPLRLKELQKLWQGPDRGTQASLLRIRGIVHNLAGSAATYGYQTLASAATLVEDSAEALLAHFGFNDNGQQQRFVQQLNALGLLLANPRQDTPLPERPPAVRIEPGSRRIVIVDDDVAFCRYLAAEIAHFGFTVDQLHSLDDFPAYLIDHRPDAIVMDVIFPGAPKGPQVVEQVRQSIQESAPVIFISARDDLETRLAAIRAGGQAFFHKPFATTDLLDTLDQLLGLERGAPLRVLIVEDASSLALLYANTLNEAGMIAEVLGRPRDLLPTLKEFRPDLILMDIYMPEASGVELAQIIQQHRNFVGIPIIFLSAERDPAKQLAALGHGGDNFLTKPVAPEQLIKAVSIRARHYQTLRTLMQKDSLTGLLNHSRVLEQLEHESERARRQGGPLSVVLIDLDQFKAINDRWGHVAGDRVIVSLARLLRERLRRVDIIGRYGGEEFIVVLPDTPAEAAERIVDDLRQRFAAIHHHVGDQRFQATFSAGIAEFAPAGRQASLVERADAALYAAKHGGRNRICRETAG